MVCHDGRIRSVESVRPRQGGAGWEVTFTDGVGVTVTDAEVEVLVDHRPGRHRATE
jgi:hypothetical protein